MAKNLLFVSLFGLTDLYRAIAPRLEQEGYRIFWLSTHEYWTHLLKISGIQAGRILELVYDRSDFINGNSKAHLIEQIAACETKSELTMNQALMMDRFIAGKRNPDIGEYVILYYRDIKSFLQEHDIDMVFLEPTNFTEMCLFMICRELGIRVVSPRDMRYPPRRLVFFDGYRQETVFPRPHNHNSPGGRELIETFLENKPTPYYFTKLKTKRVIYPGRIAASVGRRMHMRRVVRRISLTHYDACGRISRTISRSLNSLYLRRIFRFDDFRRIQGKIAYYPLHVQPENSIDVLGSYVSDQLKLIKDIRRALPFDMTLVVKEHPNFLGNRAPRFYSEVNRIPNVTLVHFGLSSFTIYERASLVLTVSGTPAYEAGLLGIPAITFSPMFFSGLSSVRHCEDITGLKSIVGSLLNGFSRSFNDDCRFMEDLVRKSYEAFWTDPYFDQSVLAPDNIARLQDAFLTMLSYDSQ